MAEYLSAGSDVSLTKCDGIDQQAVGAMFVIAWNFMKSLTDVRARGGIRQGSLRPRASIGTVTLWRGWLPG